MYLQELHYLQMNAWLVLQIRGHSNKFLTSTNCHKNTYFGTWLYFFWWILGFEKKSFSALFYKKKSLSGSNLIFQNFKSYIFAFLTLFYFPSFQSVLWHLTSFIMKKINCGPKMFFGCYVSNPGNFCIPLQTKLLILMKASEMLNFS